MSADFPNREVWLARRATPRKFPGRYAWVSVQLATLPSKAGVAQTFAVHPGRTFSRKPIPAPTRPLRLVP